MVRIESGSESNKLVLVRGNNLLELKPKNDDGSELLGEVIGSLVGALSDGRLTESPLGLLTKAPVLTNPRLTLARARKAYNDEPNDPSRLADYMESFWKNRRPKLRVSTSDLVIPTCPWNESQITQFRGTEALPDKEDGVRDMVRFIPEVIEGDLKLIEKGFPEIQFYLYGGLSTFLDIKNEYILKGWGRSEVEIDAPYTGTNEQELKDKFEALGRKGLTVPAYAIFGVFSKDLTGKFLDEVRTVIRTVGSTKLAPGAYDVGGVLGAYFDPDGELNVNSDWAPLARDWSLGGRSFQGA